MILAWQDFQSLCGIRFTGSIRGIVYEDTTGYPKNHWTKHIHVCMRFDAFSTLISNMTILLNKSEIFGKFWIQHQVFSVFDRQPCRDM